MTRSSEELKFMTVPHALLAEFPVLRPTYEALRSSLADQEREGYFVWAVMTDVLWPHLESVLRESNDRSELRKVMAFVERLAGHPDHDVQALAAVEVAYRLLGHGNEVLLHRARPYMGPSTLERLREQEELVAAAMKRQPLLERVIRMFVK